MNNGISNLIAIFIFTLIGMGCASKHQAPDESILLKLNGASYDSQSAIGPIPLGKRIMTRLIQGRVQCNPGLDQVPLNHAQVDFLDGDKVINSTFTDRDGRFSMTFEVRNDAKYSVRFSTSKWSHSEKIYSGPRGLAGESPNDFFVDCKPSSQ